MRETGSLVKNFLDIAGSLRRDYARARIERQLLALSDRMLSDIGLSRDQITAAARQAAGMETDTPSLGRRLSTTIADLFRPVAEWLRRRRLYSELAALDDRLLADIGLSRYELREMVNNMDSVAARTLGTYPQAMRGYDMLPLALWGRARIRVDYPARFTPANNGGTRDNDRHAA